MKTLFFALSVVVPVFAGWFWDHSTQIRELSTVRLDAQNEKAALCAIRAALEENTDAKELPGNIPEWKDVEALSNYQKAPPSLQDEAMAKWLAIYFSGSQKALADIANDNVDQQSVIKNLTHDLAVAQVALMDQPKPIITDDGQNQVLRDEAVLNQGEIKRLTEENRELIEGAALRAVSVLPSESLKSLFHDRTIIVPGEPIRTETIIDEN